MCKSVNLSWGKAVQSASRVFDHFCGEHKITVGYNFAAALNSILKVNQVF